MEKTTQAWWTHSNYNLKVGTTFKATIPPSTDRGRAGDPEGTQTCLLGRGGGWRRAEKRSRALFLEVSKLKERARVPRESLLEAVQGAENPKCNYTSAHGLLMLRNSLPIAQKKASASAAWTQPRGGKEDGEGAQWFPSCSCLCPGNCHHLMM